MEMNKSIIRGYRANINFYNTDKSRITDKVLKSNMFFLEKIGYDENKRPLFVMKIGDGCRTYDELGYVVPLGTVPAYDLGDPEVQRTGSCPSCLKKGDVTPMGETVETDHYCNCGSDMCWCE